MPTPPPPRAPGPTPTHTKRKKEKKREREVEAKVISPFDFFSNVPRVIGPSIGSKRARKVDSYSVQVHWEQSYISSCFLSPLFTNISFPRNGNK